MFTAIAFLGNHVVGKALDFFASKFRSVVVERWTRHRAAEFYNAFIGEVERELAGDKSQQLTDDLSKVLEDDRASEMLFDAYRSVCFSKSKTIGPRVIGVLTAELVLQNRCASEAEANMLAAAENLCDADLISFLNFAKEYRTKAEDKKRIKEAAETARRELESRHGDPGERYQRMRQLCNSDSHDEEVKKEIQQIQQLEAEWREWREKERQCNRIGVSYEDDFLTINWHSETLTDGNELAIGQLDLNVALGGWAMRMKAFGFFWDDLNEYVSKQRVHHEESRYYSSGGTERTFTWVLRVPKSQLRLADLIERVMDDEFST